MSNRVDFFQAEYKELSIPAANESVFVEGELCERLSAAEIVYAGWPEFSWVKLTFNPESGKQEKADVLHDEYCGLIGKKICIQQIYNRSLGEVCIATVPLFAGHVESIERRIDENGQAIELIARDFSAAAERITICSRRILDSDGSLVFLENSDIVFNDDNKPNASVQMVQHNGRSYKVFCGEPAKGKLWSYAEAMGYLLSEYLQGRGLKIPSIEQLRALTGNQVVREFDVTGMSVLKALQVCCAATGIDFKFVPYDAEGDCAQAIVFYKKSGGRTVELNFQRAGQRLSVSKTNIGRLHSKRNYGPVTQRFVGQGDFKIYEATFELVKAWDGSKESNDYDKFSPSTNAEFYKVKDVYRKWSLNEAGDYSGEPYNRGAAFDFSKIFGNENYIKRRRRFLAALTADRNNKSLGYYVQVSYDGGAHWWQYLYAFNVLLDECGIWLSSDQLDMNAWVASMKGVLKFRITACVASDERLSRVVADGPINSTAEVVDDVITLAGQFKYRKVSDYSIFTNSGNESLGKADEVDDGAGLYEYVRKKASTGPKTIENIDVQTLYLDSNYQVGDKVGCSADSVDLFGVGSDNRSECLIERVQIDFDKQCTNLKIRRERKGL